MALRTAGMAREGGVDPQTLVQSRETDCECTSPCNPSGVGGQDSWCFVDDACVHDPKTGAVKPGIFSYFGRGFYKYCDPSKPSPVLEKDRWGRSTGLTNVTYGQLFGHFRLLRARVESVIAQAASLPPELGPQVAAFNRELNNDIRRLQSSMAPYCNTITEDDLAKCTVRATQADVRRFLKFDRDFTQLHRAFEAYRISAAQFRVQPTTYPSPPPPPQPSVSPSFGSSLLPPPPPPTAPTSDPFATPYNVFGQPATVAELQAENARLRAEAERARDDMRRRMEELERRLSQQQQPPITAPLFGSSSSLGTFSLAPPPPPPPPSSAPPLGPSPDRYGLKTSADPFSFGLSSPYLAPAPSNVGYSYGVGLAPENSGYTYGAGLSSAASSGDYLSPTQEFASSGYGGQNSGSSSSLLYGGSSTRGGGGNGGGKTRPKHKKK